MIVAGLRSVLSPLRLGFRFSNQSDPDFQPKVKPFNSDSVKEMIDKLIKSNDVLLFMKGTVDRPQCGYSNAVVRILQESGIKNIKGINILADPVMRDQVKIYSNWPTYPQLYLKG